MSRLERTLDWKVTPDPVHPWETRVDGQHWQVRANQIPPERIIYSLLIAGEEVEQFEPWPAAWTRPSIDEAPGDTAEVTAFKKSARDREDLQMKEDFLLELAKADQLKHVQPNPRVLRSGEEVMQMLDVTNDHSHPLTLRVEPWGESHSLPPTESFEIIGRGPRLHARLKLTTDKNGITVTAWTGSVVHVLRGTEDLSGTSKEKRAP